jgi:3-deoxy-7-phosphoheptulonate synthase
MFRQTDDLRIEGLRPLISPAIVMENFPVTEAIATTVASGRDEIGAVLRGDDDRLVVVVGPCSIHDPEAGLEYARLLAEARTQYRDDLCIVMRVYFEKPRTTVGWKGLINDPHLDGSFSINEGLQTARHFLSDVVALGLPAGSEFLDPITPQFYADLVSWGAIGARTSESQVHRELASGLSMPVGFKNGTGGSIQIAIDAIGSAAHAHHFLSVTKQGVAAIVATRGNEACHLILRGGATGPNYDAESVAAAARLLEAKGLPSRIMVDCSHANSDKDHRRQAEVAADIAEQVASGSQSIFGLMLESFLVEGRQDHSQSAPDKESLVHGQSITDACLSWEQTVPVLERLADAARKRRG